jgi:hypothetical protein
MLSEQLRHWFSYRSGESIRRPLVVFLAFLPLHMLCAQLSDTIPRPVKWGPIIQISNSAGSAFVPKLAVVGDTVHIVYLAGALYYRRSVNGGKTWAQQVEIVSDDSMSAQLWNRPLAASGRNIYVVWENRSPSGFITSVKVRRSTDGGASWLEPQMLVRNSFPFYYFAPIVAAYGEDVYVALNHSFLSHGFFMRSADCGVTWDSVHQITFGAARDGPSDLMATSAGVHIVGIRNDQPSGEEVGYLVSTDRGVTWSTGQALSTIDNYRAWEPNVAADDAGNVYVCSQDAKYGSLNGFTGTLLVRLSTDNGLNWGSEIRLSPLASALRSSVVLANNNVHAVWGDERAGTSNARVYYTGVTNNDTAWCEESWISDSTQAGGNPTVSASGNRVFVAWSSNGTIRFRAGELPQTAVEWEPQTPPNDFWASANYPNPFNPFTHIQYVLPRTGRMAISVCDNLGRDVVQLLDEAQSAGNYGIYLDGSHWASGIYYVRFRFENRLITRGVVLMR